jgi:hypothetical protein
MERGTADAGIRPRTTETIREFNVRLDEIVHVAAAG